MVIEVFSWLVYLTLVGQFPFLCYGWNESSTMLWHGQLMPYSSVVYVSASIYLHWTAG